MKYRGSFTVIMPFSRSFVPAGLTQSTQLAGPKVAFHALHLLVGLFLCRTYHAHLKYITYIVAMQLYFGQLDGYFT